MATFESATGVLEPLARPIISNHHSHLAGTRIEYVFREKASTKGGKTVLGTARLVKGLAAMLSTPGATDSDGNDYFVIEIAKDTWDLLPNDKRKALLDHELSHCQVALGDAGEVKLTIQPHDVEEFAGVLARHGLWQEDLEDFVSALGKKRLQAIAVTLPGI